MMKKRRILIITIFVFIGFLTYHILYGRLLAISPVIIGFDKYKTKKAIIYYHKKDDIADLKIIDSLIPEVEQFHKLNFNKKVKLFICKTDNEFKRYTGISSRFATISSFAIFMSGKANNERKIKSIHTDIYFKHELSHLLIHQNMSFCKFINYPNWFSEGLAVYSANQFGFDEYLAKQETYTKVKEGNFVQPKDFGTAFSSKGISVKNCKVANKYRFIYSEFGSIMNDLIKTYGKEKFIFFLHHSLQADDFYVLFNKTYKIDFTEYLKDFKIRIKSH